MPSRVSALSALEDGLLTQWAFRNKLINGNFDIWQRGASFGNGYSGYGPDRWRVDSTNVNVTRGGAVAPYGQYSLYLLPTAASNACTVQQPLEYSTLIPLIGKKVVFSFFYNAQSNQNFTAYIQKSATANSNSGGGGGWTTIVSQAFTATSSGQRGILIADVPNDGTAVGLRVVFTLSNAAQNVGLGLWWCQLEEGPVPTPFEFRPFALETVLAQAYYEVGLIAHEAYGQNPNYNSYWQQFSVRKRSAPTVTLAGLAAGANSGTPTVSAVDVAGFRPRAICNTSGQQVWTGNFLADAEI